MPLIEKFSAVRVLCIGDVMLDRFIGGAVRRISPESPVPVLSVTGTQIFAGGAANVARNVAALGGQCTLVGVVGQDATGEDLNRLIGASTGIAGALVPVAGRPTTEKIRFVAHGQHMLRADSEDASPVSAADEERLIAEIAARLPGHQVVVLSDYAKGVLTDRVVKEATGLARRAGLPVVVDPKSANFARYDGATLLTPNVPEVLRATGLDASGDEAAIAAGRQVLEKAAIEAVLITRADKGMTLVTRQDAPLHIASSAREVADVVGAGDTVIATLALALGAGAGPADAAALANTAAGIVVGKHGTATTTRSELREELAREMRRGLASPKVKVLTREGARDCVAGWRRDGLKVGFTNGCFDILHAGHVSILDFARAHCDRLVVGMNTDASVRRLKGEARPIHNEDDRALVLAALAMVDAVVPFAEDTPQELIAALEPDVLVKGSDYEVKDIVGAAEVLARGGQVLRFDLLPGRSTTGAIAKAKAGAPAGAEPMPKAAEAGR